MHACLSFSYLGHIWVPGLTQIAIRVIGSSGSAVVTRFQHWHLMKTTALKTYLYQITVLTYCIPGRIQGLVKGGAKLIQWRRMRGLSSRTRMYGLTLLQKFFVTLQFFQVKSKKKKKRSQPTATRIMDHHLTFLQLLKLPCAPIPPSPLHKNSLKNMTASA